jgi:5-methylcytosine-specific restriction endonuclease McrA
VCHGLAERTCTICGGSFVGTAKTKACSPECASKLRPQTFNVCAHCGNRFGPVDHLSRKLCSNACARAWKKGRPSPLKGIKLPHKQRSPTRQCILCGAPFRATSDFAGRKHKQKYCSKACWSVRHPPAEIQCKQCQTVFHTHQRDTIFCSRVCASLDARTSKAGAASHLWRGGKTKEAQVFRTRAAYREWRLAVFQRDGFACVLCGSRKKIEADHIIPQSERRDLALDLDNGRTLCRPCHEETETFGNRQSERMRKLRQTAIHEPTGRPFAAIASERGKVAE